jgi:tetratricopeptide (TPR) repeat protein
MTMTFLVCFVLTLHAGTTERVEAMFREAEQLTHKNQKAAALAKAEEAARELDRAFAAKENIGWHAMNGLRWTAQLAREDFLDYDKSLFYCDKMLEYADTDYWRVPARLEMALTYRAMGDFRKAQQQYDTIVATGERYRSNMLLPQAEMVLFEIGDRDKGRMFLNEALMNETVNGRARFNALKNCAARAMAKGQRDEALQWYGMLEKLPFGKAEERSRYLSQAWYEMGRIEETRGRSEQAKTLYRRALECEDGEMRYRARARDALESIEYFE